MKYRIPEYYNDFLCIGSKCKDNCCIGWEIDIDENTYKYYKCVSGEFGEELRKGIYEKPSVQFQMDLDGRCVFLNDKNLCKIYIELGKQHLCKICTEHPRFHELYGTIKESGLGLACETAAELILNQKEPVHFQETGEGFPEDETMKFLFTVREEIFRMLQNRTVPLEKRWNDMLVFTEYIQDLLNTRKLRESVSIEADAEKKQILKNMQSVEYLNSWITVYRNFEIMDDIWERLLKKTQESCKDPKDMNLDGTFYEQLMVYFVYRHFMKSAYDGNPLLKVKFAVLSCLLISRIIQCGDIVSYDLNEIDIARLYSKEIEYSKENMETLFDELIFDFI